MTRHRESFCKREGDNSQETQDLIAESESYIGQLRERGHRRTLVGVTVMTSIILCGRPIVGGTGRGVGDKVGDRRLGDSRWRRWCSGDREESQVVTGGSTLRLVIGFMGFGEAARAIAAGLKAEGERQLVAYEAFRTERTDAQAKDFGVTLLEDAVALGQQSDVIFSLVTSAAAVNAAASVAPHLSARSIYADLNSCTPKTKQAVAEVIASGAGSFTSVAVMSAVPPLRHKVPMIADGPAALRFRDAMTSVGMEIRAIDGPIGSAAAIKMCRSVFVKGLEGLMMEALLTAQAAGVADEVLSSVDASFGQMPLSELASYLLVRNLQHGERRAHELEDAASVVADLGYEPWVTDGAVKRLLWSADLQARAQGEKPEVRSYADVLTFLNAQADRTDPSI